MSIAPIDSKYFDYNVFHLETDFLEAVMDITGGAGVDVAYDFVGRDTIDCSIRCLRRRGTVVNYGGASGLMDFVSPLALAKAGSVFFIPPISPTTSRTGKRSLGGRMIFFRPSVMDMLRITIDRRFPLEAAGEAMAYLEDRPSGGKLLLGP